MVNTYKGLTASDVLIIDERYAVVKSKSDPTVLYDVDYIDKTCTCPDFKYVRKDKGDICKHVRAVLMVIQALKLRKPGV